MTVNILDFLPKNNNTEDPTYGGATIFQRVNNYYTQDFANKIQPYENSIKKWSAEYNVDKDFLAGSLSAESSLNSNITSSANASGIAQIIPSTARDIAAELGDEDIAKMSQSQIKDYLNNNPDKSIQYSAYYKRQLLDEFNGDEQKAIAAYNAGPRKVKRVTSLFGDDWLKHLPEETQSHVPTVMGLKTLYSQEQKPQIDITQFLPSKEQPTQEQPQQEIQTLSEVAPQESTLNQFWNAAQAGVADITGNFYSIPAYAGQALLGVADLINKPLNEISNIFTGTKPLREDLSVSKDIPFLVNNKLVQIPKKVSEDLSKTLPQESILSLAKKGDIGGIAKSIGIMTVRNAPNVLQTGVMAAMGVPTFNNLITIGLEQAGASTINNEKAITDNKIGPIAAFLNSTLQGGAEAGFEATGELKVLNKLVGSFKKLVLRDGEQEAKKTLFNTAKKVVNGFFEGVGTEAPSEMATQYAQDLTDKITGVKADLTGLQMFSNAVDAGAATLLLGGVPGAITGGINANKTGIKEVPTEQPPTKIQEPTAPTIQSTFGSYDNFVGGLRKEFDNTPQEQSFSEFVKSKLESESIVPITPEDKTNIMHIVEGPKQEVPSAANPTEIVPNQTPEATKSLVEKGTQGIFLYEQKDKGNIDQTTYEDAVNKLNEGYNLVSIKNNVVSMAKPGPEGIEQIALTSGKTNEVIHNNITTPENKLTPDLVKQVSEQTGISESVLHDLINKRNQEQKFLPKPTIVQGETFTTPIPVLSKELTREQKINQAKGISITQKPSKKATAVKTEQQAIKIGKPELGKNITVSNITPKETNTSTKTIVNSEELIRQQEEAKKKLEAQQNNINTDYYSTEGKEQLDTHAKELAKTIPNIQAGQTQPGLVRGIKVIEPSLNFLDETNKGNFSVPKNATHEQFAKIVGEHRNKFKQAQGPITIKQASKTNTITPNTSTSTGEAPKPITTNPDFKLEKIGNDNGFNVAISPKNNKVTFIKKNNKNVRVELPYDKAIKSLDIVENRLNPTKNKIKQSQNRPTTTNKTEVLQEVATRGVTQYNPKVHDEFIYGKGKRTINYQQGQSLDITNKAGEIQNLRNSDGSINQEVKAKIDQNPEQYNVQPTIEGEKRLTRLSSGVVETTRSGNEQALENAPDLTNLNPEEEMIAKEERIGDYVDDNNVQLSKSPNEPTIPLNTNIVLEYINTNTKIKDIVDVVDNVDALPEDLKTLLNNKDPEGTTNAFFDRKTGRITILANKITSLAKLDAIIAHELFHKGFGNLITDSFFKDSQTTIDEIFDSLSDKEKSRIIKTYFTNEGRPFVLNNLKNRYELVHEALAIRSQIYSNPTLVNKLFAKIRDWLRGIGLTRTWTDNDLKVLTTRAVEYAKNHEYKDSGYGNLKFQSKDELEQRKLKYKERLDYIKDTLKLFKKITDLKSAQINLIRYANTWIKNGDYVREITQIVNSVKKPKDIETAVKRIQDIANTIDRGKKVGAWVKTIHDYVTSRDNGRTLTKDGEQLSSEIKKPLLDLIKSQDDNLRDIYVYDVLNHLDAVGTRKVTTYTKGKNTGKQVISQPYQRAMNFEVNGKKFPLIDIVSAKNGEFFKLNENGKKWLNEKRNNEDFINNVISGNVFENNTLQAKELISKDNQIKNEISAGNHKENRNTFKKLFKQLDDITLKPLSDRIKKLNFAEKAIKQPLFIPEFTFLELDDDKEGAFYNNVFKPANTAFRNREGIERYINEKYSALFNNTELSNYSYLGQNVGNGKTETTKVTIGGKEIEVSKAQKIALFLASLDNDGLRHMIEGGITIRDKTGANKEPYRLSTDEVLDIQNSMTEEEQKIANITREYFNELGQLINQTSNKVVGFDIARKDNYFPILTNSLYVGMKENPDIQNIEQFTRNMKNYFGAGIFGTAPLKGRKTHANNPIILEDIVEAMGRTNSLVLDYIGMAETIKKLSGLIIGTKEEGAHATGYTFKQYNPELHDKLIADGQLEKIETKSGTYVDLTDDSKFESILDKELPGINETINLKQLFTKYDRESDYNIISSWFHNMKKDTFNNNQNYYESTFNKFLSNYTVAVLAGNPTIGIKQIVGIPNIFTDINLDKNTQFTNKTKNLIKALTSSINSLFTGKTNPIDQRIMGFNGSPILANRIENADRILSEIIHESSGRAITGIKAKGLKYLLSPKILLYFINRGDRINTRATWLLWEDVAKHNGLEEGTKEFNDFVVENAEKTVRRTQPATGSIFRSDIFNSRSAWSKAVTILQAQSNVQFMNMIRASRIINKASKNKDYKIASNALFQILNMTILQPVIMSSFDEIYRTARGVASWDDPQKEAFYIVKNIARYMFGVYSIIGNVSYEVFKSIMDRVMADQSGYEARVGGQSVLGDVTNSFINLLWNSYKTISDGITAPGGKNRLDLLRRDAGVLLSGLGLPAPFINQIIDITENTVKTLSE